MSEPTSSSAGFGPFEGTFGIGAAVVGVVSLLIGIVGFVDGYMEIGLLITDGDPMVQGVILLTVGAGIGITALFMGTYMTSGFSGDGHDH